MQVNLTATGSHITYGITRFTCHGAVLTVPPLPHPHSSELLELDS